MYIEGCCNVSECIMKFPSLVATNVAISSSFGKVRVLRGATLDLAITKDISWFLHRKATAPYAFVLASANMCNSTLDVVKVVVVK